MSTESTIMETTVPPGGGPLPHLHEGEDETMFVVAGRITILLDTETMTAGPGDLVRVPRGTWHGFFNAGSKPVHMVLASTPVPEYV